MQKLRTIPQDQSLGTYVANVRSFVMQGGDRVEVVGARCTLRSRDVTATVTTPALVHVPLYIQGARFTDRGRPSKMTVTCKSTQGAGSGDYQAVPVGQDTTTNHSQVFVNGQPSAGGVSTTIFYGQLASSYPWGYGTRFGVVLD